MHFTKSVLAGAFSLLVAHGTSAAITEQNWSYTYTSAGKLETANGPRTDVPDVTTYGYDANNRLASTTNALDHVESILEYDAGGRPLKVQGANSLQTHYSYTVRGWLETVTVKAISGDLVTTYTYDGQHHQLRLTKIILWSPAEYQKSVFPKMSVGHKINRDIASGKHG